MIILNEPGFAQGYYIGLFARFIKFFIIAFIFQSIIMYFFGYNSILYWILSILFSFFINTSLPIREHYPFFRHGLILFCLIIAQSYSSEYLLGKLHIFFTPNGLWVTFMLISFVAGIIHSFGRYGNGSYSRNIESIGVLLLTIFLILSFVFFWWKGGIVYLLFRIPLMFLEVIIANFILSSIHTRNEKQFEQH